MGLAREPHRSLVRAVPSAPPADAGCSFRAISQGVQQGFDVVGHDLAECVFVLGGAHRVCHVERRDILLAEHHHGSAGVAQVLVLGAQHEAPHVPGPLLRPGDLGRLQTRQRRRRLRAPAVRELAPTPRERRAAPRRLRLRAPLVELVPHPLFHLLLFEARGVDDATDQHLVGAFQEPSGQGFCTLLRHVDAQAVRAAVGDSDLIAPARHHEAAAEDGGQIVRRRAVICQDQGLLTEGLEGLQESLHDVAVDRGLAQHAQAGVIDCLAVLLAKLPAQVLKLPDHSNLRVFMLLFLLAVLIPACTERQLRCLEHCVAGHRGAQQRWRNQGAGHSEALAGIATLLPSRGLRQPQCIRTPSRLFRCPLLELCEIIVELFWRVLLLEHLRVLSESLRVFPPTLECGEALVEA
mmetsp:Transcript_72883/g.209203  ORF Transcript_72883/g.209203 Transcript_72883/m.209203 type:complete len:408 (-) Transcript_72883:425-1648(-)